MFRTTVIALLTLTSLLFTTISPVYADDRIQGLTNRLQTILDTGITSSERLNEAIGVIRAINTYVAVSTPKEASYAVSQLLRVTTPRPFLDQTLDREAKIGLATIGFENDAMAAYIEAIGTLKDPKDRLWAASIVEEKTRTTREKLPIGLITNAFRKVALEDSGLGVDPPRWYDTLWAIITSPAILSQPTTQKMLFEVMLHTQNRIILNKYRWYVAITEPYSQIDTVLDFAEKAVADYRTGIATHGRLSRDAETLLNHSRTALVTLYLLDPNHTGAGGKSIWDRIHEFPEPVRSSKLNRIIEFVKVQLTDVNEYHTISRGKPYKDYTVLAEALFMINPFIRRIGAEAHPLKEAYAGVINSGAWGQDAANKKLYEAIP